MFYGRFWYLEKTHKRLEYIELRQYFHRLSWNHDFIKNLMILFELWKNYLDEFYIFLKKVKNFLSNLWLFWRKNQWKYFKKDVFSKEMSCFHVQKIDGKQVQKRVQNTWKMMCFGVKKEIYKVHGTVLVLKKEWKLSPKIMKKLDVLRQSWMLETE